MTQRGSSIQGEREGALDDTEGREALAPVSPSLNLILDFAREQYHRQKARRESLVNRSATFLGFLAVFIGLVATAPFHQTAWRVLSVLGLVLVLMAVVLFVWITRLMTFKETPGVAGLSKGYLSKAEHETRAQVLANTWQAIDDNRCKSRNIESAYQWATTLAGAGMAAIGVGVIVAMLTV